MKEIGGYIEFEHYHGEMLHEEAVALNCGRNCLAYLFKSRGIKKLRIPYFLCDSVSKVCDREGIEKAFYHIDTQFLPTGDLKLEKDEWLYLVNLYGQLENDVILKYVAEYGRVIIDQAQGYFNDPIPGVDTLYSCRKWLGVSDGAFLYTNSVYPDELPQDESFGRMRFLMGRFERTASEFYNESNANNLYFINEPVKRMSKLTANLLHGIDYRFINQRRKDNYDYLHEELFSVNQLTLKPAAFMYPLMVSDGAVLRKKLQAEKIYIPILWPDVFDITEPESLEYKMAENILPLPIDQRYGKEEMEYMISKIRELVPYIGI